VSGAAGTPAREVVLELDGVFASYGPIRALHGISLRVHAGEIVALREYGLRSIEPYAHLCQSIDRRRLMPVVAVTRQPIRSQCIHDNEKYRIDSRGLLV